jgi:hypothetical protein
MSAALETAKFFWDVIKDGAKVNVEGKVVSVLPKGTTKDDFSGWQGPISYQEKYDELSFLFKSELADFTLTANWEYNGQYIANFNVIAEGTVDVLSNVDVSVTTLEAQMNDDDIAELPYHIDVTFHNVTGGTKRTTFRALARGDGGGQSLN